jgi:hypothetical protein
MFLKTDFEVYFPSTLQPTSRSKLAFIVTANESAVPCQSEEARTAMLAIWGLFASTTFLGLLHGAWGSWTTTNRSARNHILAFTVPSVIALAQSLMVLLGVRTGEHGVANVVLFGLYYATLNVAIVYGVQELKKLAYGAIKAKLGNFEYLGTPLANKIEIILVRVILFIGFHSLLFYSVLFPLAPVGADPYWVSGNLWQRDFMWDFPTIVIMGNNVAVLMVTLVNFYVIRVSLQSNLKQMSPMSGEAADESSSEVEKVKLKMETGIVGTVCSFALLLFLIV